MFIEISLLSLSLCAKALGLPADNGAPRTPTVYLAGDSTMALDPGNIMGWGVYLPYSLTIPVVNKAVPGQSARSYTFQGSFDTIISLVQPNDIVIIEFGHNDGGSLAVDNGRTDCPGTGDETCDGTYNGQKVLVHTFSWYLTQASQKIIAKGGKVIISSQTPNNPWQTGSWVYDGTWRFVQYAESVAKALGPDAMYVDHGAYTASIWQILGKEKTDSMFPDDHTHTGPEGAAVVAGAFVKGVLCGGDGFLKGFVKNSTASVEGVCL